MALNARDFPLNKPDSPAVAGRMRGRMAKILIWLFAIQSIYRLIALAPLHRLGMLSPIVHGGTLLLICSVAVWGFARSSERSLARLIVALAMGTIWFFLCVYDVDAALTSRVNFRPIPLNGIAEFYCDGKNWFACLPNFPPVLIAGLAAIAILAALLFWCADELAAHVQALDAWFGAALRRWREAALVLAGGAWFATWLVSPAFMFAREPLAWMLNIGEFTQGPIELVNLERRDFKVQPSPTLRPRTLVLITVDSLRADHVGLNPNAPTLTPFLRSLAQTGRLQDVGPATSICAYSYCGIIGLQSSGTWASLQNGPPLPLADVLAVNGYQSHFLLSSSHRLNANLGKLYGRNLATLLDDSSPDSSMLADDREQIRRLEHLPIAVPERSFIAIHLMSAHAAGKRFAGTKAGADTTTSWRSNYNNYYAAGVTQADDVIRQIFGVLERRGLLANALVIITADHGERTEVPPEMEPHGGPLDAETLAIPVMIYETRPSRWPRQAMVRQIDLAPTMLDMVGIATPDSWLGHSLRQNVSQSVASADSVDTAGLIALVDGRVLLFRCNIKSGKTSVVRFDGLPLADEAAALAIAPSLYAGLPRRRDGAACFKPAA